MSGILLNIEEADKINTEEQVNSSNNEELVEVNFSNTVDTSKPYSIDQLNPTSSVSNGVPESMPGDETTVLPILEKDEKLSFFRLVQKHDKAQPTTEQEAFGSVKEGNVIERAHVGDKTQFNGAVFGSVYYLIDDGTSLHVVVHKQQLLSMGDAEIAVICKHADCDYLGIKSMRYRGKDCFSKQFVYDRLWKKLKRSGHTF